MDGDSKILRRINSSVNPFLAKLFKYPGRIFPGFKIEEDKESLLKEIQGREIILEFGSGSGRHLAELARRYSDCFVLGFEIRFKRAVRTIEKAENLNNIYVFRGKAENSIELLPEKSVKKVFINFPDPWDKKRWLKHRILSNKFLTEISSLLSPGALVSVKTDHLNYFEDFLEDIDGNKLFDIIDRSNDLGDQGIVGDEGIVTEFESLFRAQKKKINFVLLRYAQS